MGSAVMLSQDLSEGAGPVGDGAIADLAAGDRRLGNGAPWYVRNVVTLEDLMRMAILGGGEALGLDGQLGSLEPGKRPAS